MELLPNALQILKLLIGKIDSGTYVFTIEIIFKNVICYLVAFFYFKGMKIQKETRKSFFWEFIELEVVFTALKYFKFGIEMEVFHLLHQDIVIDAKLEHLYRVKDGALFLSD